MISGRSALPSLIEREPHGISGVIAQPPPYFRALLALAVTGRNGEQLAQTVSVSDAQTAFRFDVPFVPQSVVLDPHYEVLRWMTGLP